MTMAQPRDTGTRDASIPPALASTASALDKTAAAPKAEFDFRETLLRWGARLEQFLDAVGDRLNPILVKEARQ